ncbi:MAG: putative peptidoglycan glycosyltransferase FtsW [Spirochaetales bacterium]|nr:putative peptidoglycan glycosyltransferase FtsW [Spirochaetales bacterium]
MSEYVIHADKPVIASRKSDPLFLISVLMLWGLGIFTILICTQGVGERFFHNRYYFLWRQLAYSAVGAAGLVFFAAVPINALRRFSLAFAVTSVVLCLFALLPVIGSARNGAPRWVSIPHVITFQPSELVKLTMVLYLSHLFDKHSDEYEENNKEFMVPAIGLSILAGSIFLQKDLSTSVMVFCIGVCMFIVSGSPVKVFVPILSLVFPVTIYVILTHRFRLLRVLSFLRPNDYTTTSGYQALASERAISTGGIWGVGTGSGLDSSLTIPEIQTDYIFAGWATAMGLVGVFGYLLLLGIFVFRGMKIAVECPNKFAALGAFGCVFSIAIQSLINLAVVCRVAPTTGIPLPFFSSGGSSLIITLCMCGFVINASHCDADNDSGVEKKKISDIEFNESFGETVVEL